MTLLTTVHDLSFVADGGGQQLRGSIGIFHGLSQCQDTFIEMAIQFALNGFIVHLIDFEGFGFSGGKRVAGLKVQAMHTQVTSLLMHVDPDLPLFLFAHSMGGLVLTAYLDSNPDIAKRVSGVIFSAPFLGFPEHLGFNVVRKYVTKFLALHLEEFALSLGLSVHLNTRNKAYMRVALTGMKAIPFISLGLLASFIPALEQVQSGANRVTYPYQMLLGEKDIIVSNKSAKEWHSKTSSKVKGMRLMAGAYHELSKEPNNNVLFETALKFMGDRLANTAQAPAHPFGAFNPESIRYYKPRPLIKKRKFWAFLLMGLAYLLIGLILAISR